LKQCLGKPDSEPTDRAFVLFRNEFGITPVNYPGTIVQLYALIAGSLNTKLQTFKKSEA
jgi:hypothetical protein